MKPHLIMPMGGAGSRFFRNGYRQPKPLIGIHGKPFFYWSVMSVKRYVDIADLTFVVLRQHIDGFGMDRVVKDFFPDARLEVLPGILPGPVFTSHKGVEWIKDDAPVLINDCDHMFKCAAMNHILNSGEFDLDGALLTFESDRAQFSYVKYDDSGNVTGTAEKRVVSSHAICGAYIFRNASLFREMAEIYVKECPYEECFMSGLYNVMCKRGMKVRDFLLDFHVEFGTPEEYEAAVKSTYFEQVGCDENY